ncbi:glutamyl-tRNA reductase [Flammeovirga agarivorans]|uniref:Glutamyl-tRNA reductase n=1 Tax=Flammeovirga agarivorans TaxID=2726742 RepID=A0A7X8SIJ5_9BACT|nr:glutamyl-tRNA reductase [Flammeovirga agarivorans]NLR90772.1 glutamyl-tRNA reductase [Flammeovirga agarivorans]
MNLYTVSIAHHNVAIENREKFKLSTLENERMVLQVKEILNLEECIILSTCNRTEIYYLNNKPLTLELLKLLCTIKCITYSEQYLPLVKSYEGDEAIQHIFNVGMGLDSLILGDLQIYGQLKDAYQKAADLGMCGAYLHRIMHVIFHTHKRVSNETLFLKGATSNAYNAVKILLGELSKTIGSKVLIVGLGEMGQSICKYLSEFDLQNIWVTNRSMSKARMISKNYGFNAIDFGLHKQKLHKFDFIISCIDGESTQYKITHFNHVPPKCIIDLGAPRSVCSQVERLGAKLYNIDDIGRLSKEAISQKKQEINTVQQIIHDEVEQFKLWQQSQVFSPTIHQLKQQLEAIRLSSLATFKKDLNQDEITAAEKVSMHLLNKIIQVPVVKLKQACLRGESEELSQALQELFTLEQPQAISSQLNN